MAETPPTWRVVVAPFPPYSNLRNGSDPEGFAIEILEAIAAERGVSLTFIPVDNPGVALARLRAGEADIYPHLVANEARRAVLDFTVPLETLRAQAFALKSRGAIYRDPFAGLRIAVVSGSIFEALAKRFPEAEIVTVTGNSELPLAVYDGRADIILANERVFRRLIDIGDSANLWEEVGPPVAELPLSMAIRNTAPEIFAEVAPAVEAFVGTRAYWEIHDAWLGGRTRGWSPARVLAVGAIILLATASAGGFAVLGIRMRSERAMLRKAEEHAEQQTALAEAVEQKNTLLQAQTKEMEELLYVVSHDLNSPLISIGGFAKIAREDLRADQTDAQHSLDRLEDNVKYMQSLIDGLLQLRSTDFVALNTEAVDLGVLIRQVLSLLDTEIGETGARILVPEDPGSVSADPKLLKRALQNLVSNGLRYGLSAPSRDLEILVCRTEDEVRIGVRDHGQGVPPEFRSIIFRLNQRLSKQGKGLGIGLSVVQRVAAAHNGTAWVEDTPGGGATFWLALAAPPKLQASPALQTRVA